MIPKLSKKKEKKKKGWEYDLFGVLYPCHPFIIDKHFIIPIFAHFLQNLVF